MTASIVCPVCGRPAHNATICRTCQRQLRTRLARLPALLAELDTTACKRDHVSPPSEVRGGSVDPPLPFKPKAARQLTATRLMLRHWVREVDATQLCRTLAAHEPDTVLCRTLTDHMPDIRRHPDARHSPTRSPSTPAPSCSSSTHPPSRLVFRSAHAPKPQTTAPHVAAKCGHGSPPRRPCGRSRNATPANTNGLPSSGRASETSSSRPLAGSRLSLPWPALSPTERQHDARTGPRHYLGRRLPAARHETDRGSVDRVG